MSNFVESSINETLLIKKFIDSNKDIHNQIGSYPISEAKKQNFINSFVDESEKTIITDLVNHVKHVSNDEFNNLIKELCDKYNEVKKENDVYILVYIPHMGSSTGALTYYNKSSFYVTNIAGQYLQYDYIIDLTGNVINDDIKNLIFNKITDLQIEINKNIYLYFCDDCSYSGEQILKIKTSFMKSLEQSISEKQNLFYYRFIIPFILNKRVFNEFLKISEITNLIQNYFISRHDGKIILSDKIIEVNNKMFVKKKCTWNEWNTAFYTALGDIELNIESNIEFRNIYLIDLNSIKDILVKNNNYVSKTADFNNNPKFGERNLIYFDHKFADNYSINQIVIPPIIENCNYPRINSEVCPPAGYRNIIYQLNGKNIKFNETKTFLQLLQQYDNDTHSIKNKYLKYKNKYLKLKNIINKYN
jgi:hypothetical protein